MDKHEINMDKYEILQYIRWSFFWSTFRGNSMNSPIGQGTRGSRDCHRKSTCGVRHGSLNLANHATLW